MESSEIDEAERDVGEEMEVMRVRLGRVGSGLTCKAGRGGNAAVAEAVPESGRPPAQTAVLELGAQSPAAGLLTYRYELVMRRVSAMRRCPDQVCGSATFFSAFLDVFQLQGAPARCVCVCLHLCVSSPQLSLYTPQSCDLGSALHVCSTACCSSLL